MPCIEGAAPRAGVVLPVLGALPDALIVGVAGLGGGSSEEVQHELAVGIGTLAGSTARARRPRPRPRAAAAAPLPAGGRGACSSRRCMPRVLPQPPTRGGELGLLVRAASLVFGFWSGGPLAQARHHAPCRTTAAPGGAPLTRSAAGRAQLALLTLACASEEGAFPTLGFCPDAQRGRLRAGGAADAGVRLRGGRVFNPGFLALTRRAAGRAQVALLTLAWGGALLLGRCDLGAGGRAVPRTLTRGADLLTTGVTADADVRGGAAAMLASLALFASVQARPPAPLLPLRPRQPGLRVVAHA